MGATQAERTAWTRAKESVAWLRECYMRRSAICRRVRRIVGNEARELGRETTVMWRALNAKHRG